ncbi:tail fiber protein [bacterium]|nr:tail fiber protein [bacterium]
MNTKTNILKSSVLIFVLLTMSLCWSTSLYGEFVPFLGEINLTAINFVPEAWSSCCYKNSLLSIQRHTALFSLMGNRFGGDGRVTFALPKLLKNLPEGHPSYTSSNLFRYILCVNGYYPKRDGSGRISDRAVGTIILTGNNFSPYNAPKCNGSLLPKQTFPQLFKVFGYSYGGSGDKFKLPDLSKITPHKCKYIVVTGGNLPNSNNGPIGYTLGTIMFLPEHHYKKNALKHWVKCDGRGLPIRGHESLYSLIGNKFGGDGRTNFRLPDLKKHNHKNLNYYICTNGIYPQRQ